MSTADLDVGYEKGSSYDRPSCGMATLSLIFGIASFLVLPFVGGFLAVVLGWNARTQIAESRGRLGGETRARAGIVLGVLNLLLCAFFVVFVLSTVRTYNSVSASTRTATITSPAPVYSPLTTGVKMANEISRSEYDLIQKLQLAGNDEPVVCIYSASTDSFNPEMAVLTTKRLSYIKDGRITPLKLTEIATILDHRKYMEKYQPQSGGYSDQFNIEIIGKDGTRMRVVVRPGLDGPSFYEALNDTWKAAGGGEVGAETEITSPKKE